MKVRLVHIVFGLFGCVAFSDRTLAEVALETRDLRFVIGDDAAVRSLAAKPSGSEYVRTADPKPIAVVYCQGRAFPATGAALANDKLTLAFAGANVRATYAVKQTPEYLAFELSRLEGQAIDRIDLVQLHVKRVPYLGTWINVAYDDGYGICLCAGNIRTNAGMSSQKDHVVMRTTAERQIALEGATAVLFGCSDPRKNFLDVMETVERDFEMPSGAANRRSPIQEYSYLWASPTPDDIHEYIKWAKRGGFRMILFSYTSFSRGVGHFAWNSRYPNGMADLKKVTDAVRAAGLRLGLHIHYNKALKSDAYVTPVPDDRLHKVRSFTLATAVDPKADTIPVNEDPKGCTLDDKRRVLKAGKELIAYKAYTTEPPFQFTGCGRGHLNTTAAAHEAGNELSLLDVDTWPIFVRFDQNTDIQDETAARIADIYRETGPYDMVYFDGAEDVHAPFWFHCANAQQRVFRHFQPAPPVCEAAAATHFSWHMISRGNAYDSVAPDQMKDFCRKAPCRGAASRALNFSRVNFGWLHGFGRSKDNYIGPDVLEFVLSRGAAWDCPFSMTVNPGQLAANPRTEDCFDVIKLWEDARIENRLTDEQRAALKDLDQEHHLMVNPQGSHELVAIDEIPNMAGGVFKAYRFQRSSDPNSTYVLIWCTRRQADLLLPVPADQLVAMRPFGTCLPVARAGKKTRLTISDRRYLLFKGMTAEQVSHLLVAAELIDG